METIILILIIVGFLAAATITPNYGTSNQSITCTFTSLANNGARQSTAIDNSTNKFDDILVFVKVKTAAASTSSSGTVIVYVFGTADGGTTYTEGAGASDASITLTSPTNARFIGILNTVANSTTYYGGPFSVAQAFGGHIPDHWGIIIYNSSGGTLDASVASAWYQGIKYDVA